MTDLVQLSCFDRTFDARRNFLFYPRTQRHCSLSFGSSFCAGSELGGYDVLFGWRFDGLSLAQCFSEQVSYGRCRKPRLRFLHWNLRNAQRKPVHDFCNFDNYFYKRRNGIDESLFEKIFSYQYFFKNSISFARPHARKPRLVADSGFDQIYDASAFDYACRCRNYI